MTTMLVSRDNLVFIKKELRIALPHIGSSHVSEALAAGLGFQTNAAMLAAIEKNAHTPLCEINPARMADRLARFGHHVDDLQRVVGILRSPMLPERTFVEFRNGDGASNAQWFKECRRRNIPMISIETRRKFVKLRWDCITIDSRYEAHLQEEAGTRLVHEMFAEFQSMACGASGKPLFNGTSFVGSVDRLSPELARDIADVFFAALYVPMHESAKAA